MRARRRGHAAAVAVVALLALVPPPSFAAGPGRPPILGFVAARAGSNASAGSRAIAGESLGFEALDFFGTPRPARTAPLPGGNAMPEVSVLADDGTRVIAAIGRIEDAKDIAVVVPGMGRNRDNFGLDVDPASGQYVALDDGTMHRAVSLYRQMATVAEAPVAVIAFLGYVPPQDFDVLAAMSTRRARAGAPALAAMTRRLRTAAPSAHVTWICHSYGSLVCAAASRRLTDRDDLVLIGSPGTGASSADDLGPARVWAGVATGDLIALVGIAQQMDLSPLGLPPTDEAFGARSLDVGAVGHSHYFEPGTGAVRALAAVATGHAGHGES